MKKTIGIILLAVFLALTFTACGGGGGGSNAISNLFNKNNNANKDNFAGRNFTDNKMWGDGGTTETMFYFGAEGTGTVRVILEGGAEQACTYNKPTGTSNVNLIIKNAAGTEIFNQSCNFGDSGSFTTKKKSSNDTITFNKF